MSQDTGAIFEEIRAGDIFVHHPYQDFDTSVLRFVESATRDPQVLAIIFRGGLGMLSTDAQLRPMERRDRMPPGAKTDYKIAIQD